MAKIHAYLNFNGNCKEAFDFYQNVFNSPVTGTYYFDDMPNVPGEPALPEEAKGKVMHTSLALGNNTMLMGSDIVEGFGQKLSFGNATYIMVDTESADEAQRLFQALAKDAKLMEMELGETFFAEQFASFQDQFGIYWMIHFEGNKKMN